MKIALDAAGGDHGLTPNIDGAVTAANAFGVELVLVGPEKNIRAELSARGIGSGDARFEIVDAPDAVGMDEEPAAACRAKPRSSVMVCAELVAAGRAAGMVSAGPAGATVAAVTLWHLKRVPGILRPAIAVPIPTPNGVAILLDAGANVDCKPWHLVQFAMMGSLLARHVYGVDKPTVGLLSIGAEEGKGSDLVKEAFVALKAAGINFAGAVEGRDVPAGKTDVVVCDGFVGNVLVKTMEGTAAAVVNLLKAELTASWRYKIPALALRGPFSRMKKKMSPDECGGAPLVGVNGVVIVCHGSSSARAIASAVRAAAKSVESGFVAALREAAARPSIEDKENHHAAQR